MAAAATFQGATNSPGGGVNPLSFTGTAIGTASSDRYVVVGFVGGSSSATSVTVAGQACTQLVANTGGINKAQIFITNAPVTSGTTATIEVNTSPAGAGVCAILVWSVTGNGTTPDGTGTSSTNGTGAAVTTTASGTLIAVCASGNNASTSTWTNVTKETGLPVTVVAFSLSATAGSNSALGGGTLTVNHSWSTPSNPAMAAVALPAAASGSAAGSSSGAGAALGVGASVIAAAGVSAGAGAASGVGALTKQTTGVSAGASSVSGFSAATATAVGASSGTGAVTGAGASSGTGQGVGTAQGVATATAVGQRIVSAVGSAAGSSTATAPFIAITEIAPVNPINMGAGRSVGSSKRGKYIPQPDEYALLMQFIAEEEAQYRAAFEQIAAQLMQGLTAQERLLTGGIAQPTSPPPEGPISLADLASQFGPPVR